MRPPVSSYACALYYVRCSAYLPRPLLFLLANSVANSLPSHCYRLVITNRSYYHSAPALWNTLPANLRQIFHHFTSSQPICNSPVSALSSSLFLKSSRLIFFIFHFLHSLYSPGLHLDWHLQYWPSSITSSYTHFVIIHLHFIHAYFLFFVLNCKCLRISWL